MTRKAVVHYAAQCEIQALATPPAWPPVVIQGRQLYAKDIRMIRSIMEEHRDWCRTRISEELCQRWNWRNALGRCKDMAARTLLLKLERAGHIRLPKRRCPPANRLRNRNLPLVAHSTELINCGLDELQPLAISIVVPGSNDQRLFNCLLSHYHYLGHRNTVGENIRYLARDCTGRPLGCALFGSAAWKCAARDVWIGWNQACRERNLGLLTNNTRFLILPWVSVPHLASHLLSILARRIRADWQGKYGHPVHALETFVDRNRFLGTCYQAANWLRLGSTQGRTRNDRRHCLHASVKDIYFYPLIPNCRRVLCTGLCATKAQVGGDIVAE